MLEPSISLRSAAACFQKLFFSTSQFRTNVINSIPLENFSSKFFKLGMQFLQVCVRLKLLFLLSVWLHHSHQSITKTTNFTLLACTGNSLSEQDNPEAGSIAPEVCYDNFLTSDLHRI